MTWWGACEAYCAAVIAGLDLPGASVVGQVAVNGDNAQVRLDAHVVFLARFAGGWVSAAECVRRTPETSPGSVCEVAP